MSQIWDLRTYWGSLLKFLYSYSIDHILNIDSIGNLGASFFVYFTIANFTKYFLK